MQRPTLFCGRQDRLIARIKMMLYSWRFIDQVDGALVVIWPKLADRYADEDVDYSPCQIFDLLAFYGSGNAGRIVFLEANQRPPEWATHLDAPEFAEQAKSGFDRAMFRDGGAFAYSGTQRFRFADEPDDATYKFAGMKRLFQSLPVHRQVESARKLFYQRNGLEVGKFETLHVRRGDVYDMLRSELPGWTSGVLTSARLDLIIGHFVHRTAPLDFYGPAIEAAIARGHKLVFTSDSPEVIDEFRSIYGKDRFIDLSKASMRVAIQKAFLDFLVLSDSAHIISTSSNYSSLAAEIGSNSFSNVAGLGSLDLMKKTFRSKILELSSGIDESTEQEAMARLEQQFSSFSARRVASLRRTPEAIPQAVAV